MKKLKTGIKAASVAMWMLCCVSCMNGGDSPWVGKWQLREYQYPNGSTAKVDSVFYGFQKGSFLTYYMGTDGNYRSMYGYYEEGNDEITINLWQPSVGGCNLPEMVRMGKQFAYFQGGRTDIEENPVELS